MFYGPLKIYSNVIEREQSNEDIQCMFYNFGKEDTLARYLILSKEFILKTSLESHSNNQDTTRWIVDNSRIYTVKQLRTSLKEMKCSRSIKIREGYESVKRHCIIY